MKLVVIGLDGASFELIDLWINRGELPNIARIKKEGVWSDMSCVLPPCTSPNWKCYSTGKNPGKLGIFWWENIDWGNCRIHFPASMLSENMEIWDYLGDEGIKVGIAGMPMTHPPKKVNGFLIAGGEAGEKNFTYPETIEADIIKAGWQNLPKTSLEIDSDKASQEIHEIIDKQFKVIENLVEQHHVDFLHATIFSINILQHYLWDAEATKKGWQIIDKHIGNFIDKGCDLIIMSDHGSNKIEHVFNINTWLQKQGYLKVNLGTTGFLHKLGISQQSIMRLLSKLRLLGLAKKIVPSNMRRALPDASEGLRREAKASNINWQKSKAVASGQGPIYINPILTNEDKEKLIGEIKQKLESITDPETGNKLIERVYGRDEIYNGKYITEAPDLIIDQAKGVHIPGGIGHSKIFDSPQRWLAENKKSGLFMACGPNIKSGDKISNVSILDLAPTILHLMDTAIPKDMDGRVLKEIFGEGTKPAISEIKVRKPGTSKPEKIKGIIQSLKKQGKI